MEERPRTYRNKAHKDSLKYMRSRKLAYEEDAKQSVSNSSMPQNRFPSSFYAAIRHKDHAYPKQRLRREPARKILRTSRSTMRQPYTFPFH